MNNILKRLFDPRQMESDKHPMEMEIEVEEIPQEVLMEAEDASRAFDTAWYRRFRAALVTRKSDIMRDNESDGMARLQEIVKLEDALTDSERGVLAVKTGTVNNA